MTPFDAGALLAMLLAFYPIVSVPELQRARRERPEYFSGGELVSTGGEKLRLPDGRIFDLILNVSGPVHARRWQVIEPGPGGAGDGFDLEEGPLRPLDEQLLPPIAGEPVFASLVAEGVGALLDTADVFDAGELLMAGNASGQTFEDVFAAEVAPAELKLDEQLATFDALDPREGLEQTDGLAGQIDRGESDVPEPDDEPGDMVPDDPGPPPRDDPDDERGGRPGGKVE